VLALVAGCDGSPKTAGHKAIVERKSATGAGAVPSVRPELAAEPRDIKSLAGLWRVARVDVDPVEPQDFTRDDPRLLGSLLEITPEQLAWTYRADATFPDAGICTQPFAGPIEASTADRQLRPKFIAAVNRLLPGQTLSGKPHEFECMGGGRFGPGTVGTSNFYSLGPDRLVTDWSGGTVLLMDRLETYHSGSDKGTPLRANDYAE